MTRVNIMIIMSLLFLTACVVKIAHAADVIAVGIGQVSVVRAQGSIGTVAVGNPQIADVAIEGGNTVIVFGKKPGATDLVLMSNGHREILRSRIVVSTGAGPDTIVVRRSGERGITEEAWYCAPNCARTGEK